jgi:hypothetical protein
MKSYFFCYVTLCNPLKVNRRSRALLATCFMLVSCLSYSSTLKMEATCSSETSVEFKLTTRRYIPEARTLQTIRCPSAELRITPWQHMGIGDMVSCIASLGSHAPSLEKAACSHCIRGWVGSRADLDSVKKRKVSFSCWESNHDTSVVQTVA